MHTTDTWNSVFDRMYSLSRAMDQMGSEASAEGALPLWLPPVDTYETADAFIVQADLPGVRPEDVDITYKQRTITLQGVRNSPLTAREQGEFRVYNVERTSGRFARSVRLPDYVDGDRISAQFTDGVLTISIPKMPSAQPRKITISGGSEAKQIGQ